MDKKKERGKYKVSVKKDLIIKLLQFVKEDKDSKESKNKDV